MSMGHPQIQSRPIFGEACEKPPTHRKPRKRLYLLGCLTAKEGMPAASQVMLAWPFQKRNGIRKEQIQPRSNVNPREDRAVRSQDDSWAPDTEGNQAWGDEHVVLIKMKMPNVIEPPSLSEFQHEALWWAWLILTRTCLSWPCAKDTPDFSFMPYCMDQLNLQKAAALI